MKKSFLAEKLADKFLDQYQYAIGSKEYSAASNAFCVGYTIGSKSHRKNIELIKNLSNLFEGLDMENLDAADFVDRAADIVELVNKANEIKALEELK